MVSFICRAVADETGVDVHSIDPAAEFAVLGLDSVNSMAVLDQVETQLGMAVDPLHFWNFPTIDAFSAFLADTHRPGNET